MKEQIIIFSEDVWSQSRIDVMKVFKSFEMAYDNIADQNSGGFDSYLPTNMVEMKMMIETRPRYPSNKLTFTIADIVKDKPLNFLNIFFSLNAKFDVDVILEDSKRHNINSFFVFYTLD